MDKDFALFFMEQCVGGYSGHIATIDFNPVIASILKPMMRNERTTIEQHAFAAVMRRVADAIDGGI